MPETSPLFLSVRGRLTGRMVASFQRAADLPPVPAHPASPFLGLWAPSPASASGVTALLVPQLTACSLCCSVLGPVFLTAWVFTGQARAPGS